MDQTPKKDGGPAFPNVAEILGKTEHGYLTRQLTNGGMSLRDWFAGQALIGLMRDHNLAGDLDTARCAYGYADAMLLMREDVPK